MRPFIILFIAISLPLSVLHAGDVSFNRAPLAEKPYSELPLGSVRPQGWLQDQLQRMANGMSGHLDELYPEVCGPRNAWLGGDGDTWERGPYWIDGLYPLAVLLNDEALRNKAMQWIEWTLSNQRPDGQIGPYPVDDKKRERPPPEGAQIAKPDDWWPRMVMLKILQQHYSATGDPRVIDCMRRYFKYQLSELPTRPLHDPDNSQSGSWWARQRGGDNLMAVYWLYNITGDAFLLELADLIYSQTTPFTDQFLGRNTIRLKRYEGILDEANNAYINNGSYHCVNVGQAMKTPVIRYQSDRNPDHLKAVEYAFTDLERYHGQPHTLFGGDEGLHGRELTRGSELCTAVEMMFSLEKMLEITADASFADRLEMVAYNMLPTQITDDFMGRQYFQQANQISATFGDRNFHNDNGDRVVFGLTSGYPCCTCNLHQGWPKFVHHMWMATNDGGLAAAVYGPTTVNWHIGDTKVSISEETVYPMEDTVRFVVSAEKQVSFPLHLRIPAWCSEPAIAINGTPYNFSVENNRVVIARAWKNNDVVTLHLNHRLRVKRWHENSASLYWGPLLFALRMKEDWSERTDPSPQGKPYLEVRSDTHWNVALIENHLRDPASSFVVESQAPNDSYFWNEENAPLRIKAEGFYHPNWTEYNGQAGPIPFSPQNPWGTRIYWKPQPAQFELIPYGCSTLRISAFPTIVLPRNRN